MIKRLAGVVQSTCTCVLKQESCSSQLCTQLMCFRVRPHNKYHLNSVSFPIYNQHKGKKFTESLVFHMKTGIL